MRNKQKYWNVDFISDVNQIVIRYFNDGNKCFSWYYELGDDENWLKWEDDNIYKDKYIIKKEFVCLSNILGVSLKDQFGNEKCVLVTKSKNKKTL